MVPVGSCATHRGREQVANTATNPEQQSTATHAQLVDRSIAGPIVFSLLERGRGVAVFGDERGPLAVEVGIVGRPGGEPVDVAVEHAERRGDEHGVVDFEVGGAQLARALDVGGVTCLPLCRRLAGDDEQRLELVGDARRAAESCFTRRTRSSSPLR